MIHTLLLALGASLPLSTGSEALPAGAAQPGPGSASERVLVLGFDGADYRTTARMIEEGELPNLAKLAASGTFAPLRSTNPAESAAGWAAINTGRNPVENGVPSFVNRRIAGSTPVPDTAHIKIESNVPIEEFELDGFLGLVAGRSPLELGLAGGGGAALVVFLLLGLVLGIRKPLAALLALVVGAAGGWSAAGSLENVPTEAAVVFRNKVKAAGFWDHAGEAGVPSIVLDAALAFGRPHAPNTRVLGGLGLPDVRGGISGEWFVYTSDDIWFDSGPKGERAGDTGSGTVFALTEDADGAYRSSVWGPLDIHARARASRELQRIDALLADPKLTWKESQSLRDERAASEDVLNGMRSRPWEHRTSLPLLIEPTDGGASVTLADQRQDLVEGAWSDWYHLNFELGPLLNVRAITRVKLVSAADPVTVYVDSLGIDPREPPFWQPISQPREFSRELAEWLGEPYETLGWACLTNQMKDERIGVQAFLEDIEFTMEWRRRLLDRALSRDDWRLLFSVYSVTDRVQHILYRHADPEHPMHDPEEAAQLVRFFGKELPLSECIDEVYRQMDARVGEVLERLRESDRLLLCADHGFSSFRRQMDVNAWLAQEGFLTIKEGATARSGSGGFGYVDWSRTQAYSLGLGMVYLNLAGREPQGIVQEDEARGILEDIAARFVAATDGGQSVGRDAEVVWDLYPGDWTSTDYPCSDLMLGFDEYYRAGWNTVTGGARLVEEDGKVGPGAIYRDNTNPWSGDHAGNSPNLVTGIFFSNRPVEVPEGGVSVLHVAPTVLEALGVPVPQEMDLAPLATR